VQPTRCVRPVGPSVDATCVSGFGHGEGSVDVAAPRTATAAAIYAPSGRRRRGTSCGLVVEGDSDCGALEMLAARLGRSLEAEGVALLPLGGATNLGHLLHEVARAHAHVRVAGLCDADQQGAFCRHLEAAGLGEDLDRDGMEKLGFFVGNADLEDELIRALGIDEVLEVISAQKEHATFETFRKQPAQRGRAVDASFAGSSAHALVASFATPARWWMSFDLGCVPRPLAAVLACCAPAADGLAVQSSVRRCAEPHQRGR
jgi:hypothetical protein